MKKKWTALACAMALLFALSLPALSVNETPGVYILAVNDKFCDLPGGALPTVSNGVVYVPYSVFDKNATGVDLGVYYGIGLGQSRGTTITLYSREGKMLIFEINMGTCLDGDGNTMPFRGTAKNAVPYVPIAAVCAFFGLKYSFLPTTNRGTLIRVASSTATMTDNQFLSTGAQGMTTRYNNILKNMDLPVPSTSSTPAPAISAAPGGAKGDVRVYLAVDASHADESLLALFPSDVRILFLFSPDALAGQSALVRKAVAAGHSVGFTVSGSPEEAQEQLARGNRLLSHITRTRTRLVYAPEELREDLTASGWLCWRPNVNESASYTILSLVDKARSDVRVQLPESLSVIGRTIPQLREDGYDLRVPIETDL